MLNVEISLCYQMKEVETKQSASNCVNYVKQHELWGVASHTFIVWWRQGERVCRHLDEEAAAAGTVGKLCRRKLFQTGALLLLDPQWRWKPVRESWLASSASLKQCFSWEGQLQLLQNLLSQLHRLTVNRAQSTQPHSQHRLDQQPATIMVETVRQQVKLFPIVHYQHRRAVLPYPIQPIPSTLSLWAFKTSFKNILWCSEDH